MDGEDNENQSHKKAIQSFKEFTGIQDDLTANRLLLLYDWDIQKAINMYFLRGIPPQIESIVKEKNILVDNEEEEIQAIYQSTSEPKRRISHFIKRSKNLVEKTQKDDKIEQKANNKIDDDNSEDNIRAPIPAVRGVMLAQTFRETYENGHFPRSSTSIFDQFRNSPSTKNSSEIGEELMEESTKISTSQEKSRQRTALSPPTSSFKKIKLHPRSIEEENAKKSDINQNDQSNVQNGQQEKQKEEEEEAQTTTTGGFGHRIKKRRDLRLLFRPPTDLIFYGDWDLALQTARQTRQWLLVNVQNSSEFACAVLNRDIWSDETVKDVVKTNFLFWQVYHDSPDGVRVKCYYRFENYPALFIIDPRTGEEVLKLVATDSVSFLDNLTTFLAHYPTFEARDQEFKQMALLGDKHPLLCINGLRQENSTTFNNSSIIGGCVAASSSSDSCGKKRKQPADDNDYIDE